MSMENVLSGEESVADDDDDDQGLYLEGWRGRDFPVWLD